MSAPSRKRPRDSQSSTPLPSDIPYNVIDQTIEHLTRIKQLHVEIEARESRLNAREVRLNAFESDLDARKRQIDAREATIESKQKALHQQKQSLQEQTAMFEQEIAQFMAEKRVSHDHNGASSSETVHEQPLSTHFSVASTAAGSLADSDFYSQHRSVEPLVQQNGSTDASDLRHDSTPLPTPPLLPFVGAESPPQPQVKTEPQTMPSMVLSPTEFLSQMSMTSLMPSLNEVSRTRTPPSLVPSRPSKPSRGSLDMSIPENVILHKEYQQMLQRIARQKQHLEVNVVRTMPLDDIGYVDEDSNTWFTQLARLHAAYPPDQWHHVTNAQFMMREKVHFLMDGKWCNGVVVGVAKTEEILRLMQADHAFAKVLCDIKKFPIGGLLLPLAAFQHESQLPTFHHFCYAVARRSNKTINWYAQPMIRTGWVKKEVKAKDPEALGVTDPPKFMLSGTKPKGDPNVIWPPALAKDLPKPSKS